MPPYVQPFIQPIMDQSSQTAIFGVFLLISLDILVGVVCATFTKTLSSKKMRDGLVHKFTELVGMALAIILDGLFLGGLELSVQPVLLCTCAYIAYMEVGSVLELIKKYNPDAAGLVGWITSFVQAKDQERGE